MKSVHKEPEKRKVSYVYLKDVLLEKRMYIDMARKMADLYEDLLERSSFFRMAAERIFES